MRALVAGLLQILFYDCCFVGPSGGTSITVDSEELPLDAVVWVWLAQPSCS